MALFNPKIPKLPSFKFDPSKHSLAPEPAGFDIPSLDIPDLSSYRTPDEEYPGLKYLDMDARKLPEEALGAKLSPTSHIAYNQRIPTKGYGVSNADFSGIEPYTMPTKTRRTLSRTPSYPTETSYTPSRSSQTSTRQAAPIPYGSRTSWQPSGEMPTMGELPEYMTPEMDRARIGELTELGMGAPMGRLKEGLDRALLEARYSTNPMVRAMARKQALSGYGAGITDVRTGAHREAMSEYMPEFQSQLAKSQAEYQAKIQKIRDQFQSDMQDYIRKGKQITTPIEGRRGTASTDPRYRIDWRV